jgi:hypothetical protein
MTQMTQIFGNPICAICVICGQKSEANGFRYMLKCGSSDFEHRRRLLVCDRLMLATLLLLISLLCVRAFPSAGLVPVRVLSNRPSRRSRS